MRISVSILAVFVAAVMSIDALACADTLYRVGKGVASREYIAPLPGNVLVYGHTDGSRQLADALLRTGHVVHFVADAETLNVELATAQYDVVIAPLADGDAVTASLGAAGRRTALIPVARTRDEAKVAAKTHASVMVAGRDEIKHYLKAIHKALKENNPDSF